MNVFDLVAMITLDTSEYTRGLKDAGDQASKFGAGKALAKAAKIGGAALAATSTALLAFGKSSVSTGKEFDSSMSQIAATLGYTTDDIANNVDGAGDNFDALRKKAQEMGSETNFSASEAAEGLNILAMSGYDAEQSMGMIEDVLHLAAAGSMDMASAAGYVSGAMKGFNDETKDSGYYADLMAKGATLANTSVSQLGDAMSSGSATAAAYNQDAQSMTVALLRLAEQGEVGAAAGTALNAAMKDLFTPTDQAKGALNELGVEVYDESGKARDFNDVVDDLTEAMEGMSDEEKNAYKQTIFGIQGLNAYNKMSVTSRKTQEKWNKALAEASDGAGEAAKQYNTMTDNLEGDVDIWKSAIDGFKIAVSDQLMPTIRDFVKFGSDSVGKFTKAFTEGGLPALATEVGKALTNLLKKISEKLPSFVQAGANFLNSILTGIIDMLPSLASAATDIIVSLSNYLGEQLPTLITRAAEVIVTIIEGLSQNADKLVAGAAKVFEGLSSALSKAIPMILNAIPGLVKALVSAIADNFSSLAPVVALSVGKHLLSGVKTGASGIMGDVKNFLTGPGGLVVGIAAMFFGLGAAIANSMSEAYTEAYNSAKGFTDSEQELIDKINDEKARWEEVAKARHDAAVDVDYQVGKYKELWDRLQEIVDENGNVREGYEKEAEYITGELSKALDIEINMVDGQIDKYKELKGTIDTVIERKKAELLLSANEEEYVNALKNHDAAAQSLVEAEALLKTQEEKVSAAEAEVARIQEKINKLNEDGMEGTYDYKNAYDALERELKTAKGVRDAEAEDLVEAKQKYRDAQDSLANYASTINNYDAVLEALATGSMEDVQNALDNMVQGFITAESGTSETLSRQTYNYAQELAKQIALVQKTGSTEAKELAAGAKLMVDKSLAELEKLDPQSAAEMKKMLNTMIAYKKDFVSLGEDLASGVASGVTSKSYIIDNAARNAMNNALAAAKKIARVYSPSRVWRDELGVMLGLGVAEGIDDSSEDVNNSVGDMLNAAILEAQRSLDQTEIKLPPEALDHKEFDENLKKIISLPPELLGKDGKDGDKIIKLPPEALDAKGFEDKLKGIISLPPELLGGPKARDKNRFISLPPEILGGEPQTTAANDWKVSVKDEPITYDDYYPESQQIVINVYGTTGQDIKDLADEVAKRLQKMYTREARRYA